jgi:hypothetical protein
VSQYDRDNLAAACAVRSWYNPVRLLLRAGVVRPQHYDVTRLRWPVHVSPKHIWVYLWRSPGQRVGLFRNLPGVVRDYGTWLPRRWGFHILGFEIGQRG